MLDVLYFLRILCYSFTELQAHPSALFFRIKRIVVGLEEIITSIALALCQVGQQEVVFSFPKYDV